MPRKDDTGFRASCDQIWKFRLAHAGELPKRKSDDAEERRLARVMARYAMREKGYIETGTCPCHKQLSPDDVKYLRQTLDEPCGAHASDSSDLAASRALNRSSRASRGEDGVVPADKVRRLSTIGAIAECRKECDPSDLTASPHEVCISLARKIGVDVLAWQALQCCQRIPNRRSQDENEKKLGKRFEDVLRRRYCAIDNRLCQQKLSADVLRFINGIPGVPPHVCSVNRRLRGVGKGKQKRMSPEEYQEKIDRLLDDNDFDGAVQLKTTYEKQVKEDPCESEAEGADTEEEVEEEEEEEEESSAAEEEANENTARILKLLYRTSKAHHHLIARTMLASKRS